jgi:hypothetical protein
MAALMQNRKGIADQLRAVSYTGPALVPATPWLGSTTPGTPGVAAARKGDGVYLKLAAGKANALYAIWSRYGKQWRFATVVPASRVDWTVPDDVKLGASPIWWWSARRPPGQRKRARAGLACIEDLAAHTGTRT